VIDLSRLRPLPSVVRASTGPTEDDLAASRQAAHEAEQAAIAHHFLAGRARRLLPGCTDAERAELNRLINAGPGHGLRHAVYHLELAGVRPVPESLCA
jgi:hypothetical protein